MNSLDEYYACMYIRILYFKDLYTLMLALLRLRS